MNGDALGTREETAPWNWQRLDADGALATWSAVASFVEWAVRRYDLGDSLPRRWYLHGALIEELTALWAAWTAAYLNSDAGPDGPLSWHERFAQARIRLTEWDRLGCAQRGHVDGTPAEWPFDRAAFASFVAADCTGRNVAEHLHVVPDVGNSAPTPLREPRC